MIFFGVSKARPGEGNEPGGGKPSLRIMAMMSCRAGDFYYGGRWVRADPKQRRFPCVNPATEQIFDDIGLATPKVVSDAVNAARECYDQGDWSSQTPIQVSRRIYLLRKTAELIRKEKGALASTETRDCGKPLEESEWDVDDASGVFEHFASVLERRVMTRDVDLGDDSFAGSLRAEAVGVVALITPWNYPLLMACWKVAPALAAGCCVVLKPSEHASLTCLHLASILHRSGFPPGSFNLITGDGPSAGAALASHPHVHKTSFTGSTATGESVALAAARQCKPCSLELGGKSALIVFEDCDIDKAVEWAMFGCFWTNGQICSATSRVLVHSSIHDDFLEALQARTLEIRAGDPMSRGTRLGPLVSAAQRDRVVGMIRRAEEEGARLVCGGGRPKGVVMDGVGYYVEPTVFADVDDSSELWREEVFGPVLAVRPFDTEEEAVEAANATKYGLAAAVISSDAARCERVARRMRTGLVWVNCSQPCFPQLPWGGKVGRASGHGRDLGEAGLDAYLDLKSVVTYTSADKWDWYPQQHKSKL